MDHTIRKDTVVYDLKAKAETRGIPVEIVDYQTLMNRDSTEIDADPIGCAGGL